MAEQVAFRLRNRNPDVLTSIANLSNDEVFAAGVGEPDAGPRHGGVGGKP